MQYLFLIYEPTRTAEPTEAEIAAMWEAYGAFTQEAADRGVMRGGDALAPVSAATTIRVRGASTLITDGPFAETKETLGGYYVLDCRDLDEAIELAAKIPGARDGAIEIRPIMATPEPRASA
jgi:hypothetical protein